jgi:C-terminal processing protease CtpA/Prc
MKSFFILLMIIVSFYSLPAQEQSINNELVMSQDEIRLVIQNIVFELENTYLYPEKIKHLSQILLAKLNTAGFHKNYNTEKFRRDLRSILVKETHDTGFDIIQQKPTITSNRTANNTEFNTPFDSAVKVEVLDNNIGYLRITGDVFYGAHKSILDAFEFLSDVDAMIIDLRSADEVTISLVQQMVSYFIPADTLIGNIKFNSHISSLFSLKTQGFDNFKNKFPLYILNSSFVAGEWEFLGYTLKHFDKAVIVGEDTMGFGYFTKSVKISDKLSLKIPYALISHPISNETWDNDGVVSDFYAKGDEILEKAYSLALTQLSEY